MTTPDAIFRIVLPEAAHRLDPYQRARLLYLGGQTEIPVAVGEAIAAAWHEVNGATLRADEADPIAKAARLAYERGSKVRPWDADEERTWVNAIVNLLASVSIGPYGSIVACSGGDDLVAKLMAAWAARADEADALTRARADLAAMTKERDEATERHRLEADRVFAAGHAAERKTWQDATCCDTPADVKAKADRWEKVSRANLESIDGHRKRVDMAEREIERLLARAEAAEREVARLTGAGVGAGAVAGWAVMNGESVDCVVEAKHKTAADEIAQKNRDRIATCSEPHMAATAKNIRVAPLYLAHGRAASPPPDASDEEIARAYTDARAAELPSISPWDEIGNGLRRAAIAAVRTVIRPRLDALRAEVTRLTTALAAAEQHRDALRDALTGAEAAARRAEQRADEHMGDLRAIAAHLKCGHSVDAVKKAIKDRAVEAFRRGWAEGVESVGTDGAALDRAVAAYFPEATKAPVPVSPPPTPSPRFVAVKRDEVNGRHGCCHMTMEDAEVCAASANRSPIDFTPDDHIYLGGLDGYNFAVVDTDATPPAKTPRAVCPTHGDTVTCTCTTGAPHCHACGHTPPFCDECDDHHDKGAACATPPAALPQVEAFELPAVKWTRDEDNDTDPDDETSHTAWRPGGGIRSEYASTWFETGAVGWSLLLDGTAPDEPTARSRVESAVALLTGRATVRR